MNSIIEYLEKPERLKKEVFEDKIAQDLLNQLVADENILNELKNKTIKELKVFVEGIISEDVIKKIIEEKSSSILEELSEEDKISVNEVEKRLLDIIRYQTFFAICEKIHNDP